MAAPRAAAVVYLHGFGDHSGLYHRFGNTLKGAGIELWALDEIGHGLTEGDRAVIWLAGHSLGSVAAAVSAARDPGRYAGLVLYGAALSPLDWVLALGNDDAAERGSRVASPHEEMAADRVQATIGVDPRVGAETLDQLRPARGPATMLVATAWLGAATGLSSKRSRTS